MCKKGLRQPPPDMIAFPNLTGVRKVEVCFDGGSIAFEMAFLYVPGDDFTCRINSVSKYTPLFRIMNIQYF
jgi:hypothetical protein